MTKFFFTSPAIGDHALDIGYAQNYSFLNSDGHLQQAQPGAGPGADDEIDTLDGLNGVMSGSISVGLVDEAMIEGSASLTTKAGGTLDANGGTITVNGDAYGVNAENGGMVTVDGTVVSAGAGNGGVVQVSTVTGAADAEDGGQVTVGTATGGVLASNGGTVDVDTVVDGLNAEGNVGGISVGVGGTVTVSSVTTDGTVPVQDGVGGGTLSVGTYGSGTATFNLYITDGGVATIGTIGAPVAISISGAGSHLAGQDALTIGTTGAGSVSVGSGGMQTFTSVSAGTQVTGDGDIDADAGGQLTVTGDAAIGVAGSGSVSAGGAGAMVKIGGALETGQQTGAQGSVFAGNGGIVEDEGATIFGPGRTYAILNGAGSTWKWDAPTVTIGNGYTGLDVYDGALLDASSSDVTYLGTPSSSTLPYSGLSIYGTKLDGSAGATGTMTAKSLTIGGSGRGFVNVFQGGSLQISGALSVGTLAASTPSGPGLQVIGSGATLSAKFMVLGSEIASVDDHGNWNYTDATSGSFGVASGGYASIGTTLAMVNDFSIVDGGAMEVGGDHGLGATGGPAANTLQVDAGGSITGHSSITVGSVSASGHTGTILNNGLIEAQDGTLVLNAGAIAAPTPTSGSATGSFQIDDQSTLEVTGSVAAGNVFNFNGGYETTLKLDDLGSDDAAGHSTQDFNGTVSGLQDGDTIEISANNLQTLFGTSVVAHTQISGSTLTVTMGASNTDGVNSFSIDLGGSVSGHVFTVRDLPDGNVGLTYEPDSPQVVSGSAGNQPVPGAPTNSPDIQALVWGWGAWNPANGPITYWFGSSSDKTDAIKQHGDTQELSYDTPLDSWTAVEQAAFLRSLNAYAAVSGLTFAPATSAQDANMVWWLDPSGLASLASSGSGAPDGKSEEPASVSDGHLWEYFDDTSWQADPAELSFGGFGASAITHEIGHSLGLSHPADGGTEPDRSTFPGVTAAADNGSTTGDDGQNQSVFSVMSYNNGWDQTYMNSTPHSEPADFGNQGGLGALDIAALQVLYGSNATFHSGDDTYSLPVTNATGTDYSSIWDTGGNDTITAAAASTPSLIDLRPAENTGSRAGGFVSYVGGIQGGFTIANGVNIENAIGGSGNDILIAGQAGDTLTGGAGRDTFEGDIAALAGSTISDMATGEKIVLFDANPSTFTFSYANGALTLFADGATAGATGVITLTNRTTQSFIQTADPQGGVDLYLGMIPSPPKVSISSAGGTTMQAAQTINGVVDVDDAGSTVNITDNGAAAGSSLVDPSGDWNIPLTLVQGQNTLIASDTSNTGLGTSNPIIYILDTTAPVTSSAALTVSQNAGATPIGIAAPSDNLTAAGSLAIVAGALPSDGTVTLADGTTPVTAGETLNAAELEGLAFTPTPGVFSQSSSFTYQVTDGAGNASTGTATLDVGDVGAPTIAGTHASATSAEAAVTPFAGVTLADPSSATDTVTIALSGGGGTLSGTGLVANPDGSYTLAAADPATLTQELDALAFTPARPAPVTSATTTFTLSDASSSGATATDAGTRVTDTASPDTVSFAPDAGFLDHGRFVLSGSASRLAGVSGVEISAMVEGVETDLGAATVNSDGTFSFADSVGAHQQTDITATLTDGTGQQTTSVAPFNLSAGITGEPYRAEEDYFDPASGASLGATYYLATGREFLAGAPTAESNGVMSYAYAGGVYFNGKSYSAFTDSYASDGTFVEHVEDNRDGSHAITVEAPYQAIASIGDDVFEATGQANTTFVFTLGFGTDVVEGFIAAGPAHDAVSFAQSDFASIADVLRHTQNTADGAVIHDPTSGDAVQLTGVSRAELYAHRRMDVQLHA